MEGGIWRDAERNSPKGQGVGEGEREAQEAGGGSDAGQCDSQRGGPGKLLSPSRRRKGGEVRLRKPWDLPTAGLQVLGSEGAQSQLLSTLRGKVTLKVGDYALKASIT